MRTIPFLFFVCTILLSSVSSNVFSQSRNVAISGRVVEAGSGESLVGAVVYLENSSAGVATNQYGFFTLIVPSGKVQVKCTYPTYESFDSLLIVGADTALSISLAPSTFDEVVVRQIPPVRPGGFLNIPVAQLRQVPSLMGEPDLIRALSYTPGISTGREGSTGLYVRGGSPEQNLILLDEAPMYNTAHAFGFLSVFNPDAVKNIDVYKGGFPARYGGRVASVIDLTNKEGDREKYQGGWALGLLNSRFVLEGPLKKGRSSFLVAGRTMNSGPFRQLLALRETLSKDNVTNFTNFWFYDANVKVNHTFKNRGQLLWSFNANHDYQRNSYESGATAGRNVLKWGSLTSSLRYNKSLTPRLFWRSTALFSRFNYGLQTVLKATVGGSDSEDRTKLDNSITDLGLKSSLDYTLSPAYVIRLGLEATKHSFFPGQVQFMRVKGPQTDKRTDVNEPVRTLETAGYVENDLRIAPGLKLNAGLRYSRLRVDSVTYGNWEPRVALVGTAGERHSVKLGYSRMQQYLHQLTSNGAGFPNDLWVPVTGGVAPVRSDQFELGWSSRLGWLGQWELSVETYYKPMKNLIEYRYGANILNSYEQNWQETTINGVKGKAYGFETMLQRKAGPLTGWVSYTYAKSLRQTPEINDGSWFPSHYDRRHNLALVGNYKYNDHWSFAANWVYMTGQPVTLPSAIFYNVGGWYQPYYEGRNLQRLLDFHRLDLGTTYTKISHQGREHSWSFGAYNAYNRRNPTYVVIEDVYKKTEDGLILDGYRVAARGLLPVLPYVTYQIRY